MTDRRAARATGIFFIVATLAGVLAGVVQGPATGADDVLAAAADGRARLATGAVLELVMGVAVIGIVVSITPVLWRFGQRVSLGFAIARSIETVFYGVSVIGVLTLLTINQEASGAVDRSALGAIVLGGREWGNWAVQTTAFALGAVLLNWLLYRTRLVPRWLAGWGLIGAVIYLAVGPAIAYGLEPDSTGQVLLVAPLAIEEMIFALWLIFKGFSPVQPGMVGTGAGRLA